MAAIHPRPTLSGFRLSEEERAAISLATQPNAGAERRVDARVNLPPGFALLVRLQPRNGDPVAFRATPKDLSASGLGFFHAAYIHTGTPVVFIMRDRNGNPVSVRGTVIRCRHLTGRVHEVGASFEGRVEVNIFVDGGPASQATLSPQERSLFDAVEQGGKTGAPPEKPAAERKKDIARLAGELSAMATAGAAIESMLDALHRLEALLSGTYDQNGPANAR